MAFKHNLSNGRTIKVFEGEIYGLCNPEGITVDRRQLGRDKLETYIHELLHAEFSHWNEKRVDKVAKSFAGYLWRAGYRRIMEAGRKAKKKGGE